VSDIKQIIKQEYIKCATDPVHFMKKYCFIQHPQRGKINFHLYPFQERVMTLWKDNPYSIILKSRQLGISTLGAGYALWLMSFFENKNVLALATTQATARNLVTKVQFMYNNLPSWLKVDNVENNKLSLRLKNGSRIQAKSSSPDAARSEAVSLLIVDEAAFIDNIGETWAAAQQTLATGGGALVLSTPYGVGNWFHKMWVSAQEGTNNFLPIKLPWDVHPERDQQWRDRQDLLLGDPKKAAQECDCDFNTSGDTVFPANQLTHITEETTVNPQEKRGIDKSLWVWEPVDYSKNYIVAADVARGDGQDYSAFHIIDIASNTQVAEYKGKLPTLDFGNLLVSIATEYNNALLVVENSTIGWAVIQAIQQRGYRNLYHSPKGGSVTVESFFSEWSDHSKLTPGFSMNLKTRPLAISKFLEFVNDRSVTIKSKRLLEEMKTFVWRNGKASSQEGYNDDLVMSFAIAMFMRDISLAYKSQSTDMSKTLLNGIVNSKNNNIYTNNSMVRNPYEVDLDKDKGHDIKWLL
jgi:hypothetical protein